MCNRYETERSAALIGKIFGARWSEDEASWKDQVYPRYQAPVVRVRDAGRVVEAMAWGFPNQVPGKTKMLTKHVTNARHLNKPLWRSAAATPAQHCLVPFRRFAEPRPGRDAATGQPAQWWFDTPGEPLAAFAGLWQPTDAGAVFAFLTCEPNALVAPLHEKAMPVVLLPEDYDRWLSGGYAEAKALQTPYPSQLMNMTSAPVLDSRQEHGAVSDAPDLDEIKQGSLL